MTLDKMNSEEYSIPLNIEDIISICKDYSNLGWRIQNQIESILQSGVEEAINNGNVKPEALSSIKFFLHRVCQNPLFGDATSQAQDCLQLISYYEQSHQMDIKLN